MLELRLQFSFYREYIFGGYYAKRKQRGDCYMLFAVKINSENIVLASDKNMEERGSFKSGYYTFMDMLIQPGVLYEVAQNTQDESGIVLKVTSMLKDESGAVSKPYVIIESEDFIDVTLLLEFPSFPSGKQLQELAESFNAKNKKFGLSLVGESLETLWRCKEKFLSYMTSGDTHPFVDFNGLLKGEYVAKALEEYKYVFSGTMYYLNGIANKSSPLMKKSTDPIFITLPYTYDMLLNAYLFEREDIYFSDKLVSETKEVVKDDGTIEVKTETYYTDKLSEDAKKFLNNNIDILLPDVVITPEVMNDKGELVSSSSDTDDSVLDSMLATPLNNVELSFNIDSVVPLPESEASYEAIVDISQRERAKLYYKGDTKNNFLDVPQSNEREWFEALKSLLEYDAFAQLKASGIEKPTLEQVRNAVLTYKLSDSVKVYFKDLCVNIAKVNWIDSGWFTPEETDDAEDGDSIQISDVSGRFGGDLRASSVSSITRSDKDLRKVFGEEDFVTFLKAVPRSIPDKGGYAWAEMAVILARFGERRPKLLCVSPYNRYWDLVNWMITNNSGQYFDSEIIRSDIGETLRIVGIIKGPNVQNKILEEDTSGITGIPIGLKCVREYKLDEKSTTTRDVYMSLFDFYLMQKQPNEYKDKLYGILYDEGNVKVEDSANPLFEMVSFENVIALTKSLDEKCEILQSNSLKGSILGLGSFIQSKGLLSKLTHYSALDLLCDFLISSDMVRFNTAYNSSSQHLGILDMNNELRLRKNLNILLFNGMKPYLKRYINDAVKIIEDSGGMSFSALFKSWMILLDGYKDILDIGLASGTTATEQLNKITGAITLEKIRKKENIVTLDNSIYVKQQEIPSNAVKYRFNTLDNLVACKFRHNNGFMIGVLKVANVDKSIDQAKLVAFKKPVLDLIEADKTKDYSKVNLRVESSEVLDILKENLGI
jgi:hypothetical protein